LKNFIISSIRQTNAIQNNTNVDLDYVEVNHNAITEVKYINQQAKNKEIVINNLKKNPNPIKTFSLKNF
jgi:hypothetical protein